MQLLSTSPLFLKEDVAWQEDFHSLYEDEQYIDDIRKKTKAFRKKANEVKIGNDVWIGLNVTVLQGCHIGDGAVIAAGSVVTKDVLPYSVVGGVPARIIRMRFEDNVIEKLLEIQWWNYGPDIVKGLDITQPYKILNELGERKVKMDEEGMEFHGTWFIFDSDRDTISRVDRNGKMILLYHFK